MIMSNRILGILVLLWCIGWGYLYYQLKYLPDQFENQKIQEEKQIEALKQARAPQLILRDVPEKWVSDSQIIWDNTLFSEEDIYFQSVLEDMGTVFFIQRENNLEVFLDDTYIARFPVVANDSIEVQGLINSSEYLLFVLWEQKFLYHIALRSMKELLLEIPIEYMKSSRQRGEFLIKTSVGTFLYSSLTDRFEYIHFFKDFVYFRDPETTQYSYIGLIQKSEIDRIDNLGLESDIENTSFESLIVWYDPQSKDKKVLLESDILINRIYVSDDQEIQRVLVSDREGNIYEIENL